MFHQRERVLGHEFMTRTGGPKRPRFRVTMGALDKFYPELFNDRATLPRVLQEHLDRELDPLRDTISSLVHDIGVLRRRVDGLEGEVARLRAKKLAKPTGPRS
jgi:hypothetical protein